MTDIQKPPMSPSYKAVFVLSLVMIPISMFLSAALSGGKGGASMAAIWWSFTAWYMYKRDNKSLVSQQWFLIWIQGIVGTLLFLLLILDEDLRNSLDYTPIGIVLFLAVSIPLNYALLVFFQKQISPADAVTSTDTPSQSAPYRPTDTSPSVIHVTPTPSTAAYTPSHTDPYQQAGEEVLSGNVDPAIWARSLVEGAGNESAVKAAYVKLRVAQLNAAIQAEAARIKAEEKLRLAKAEEEKIRADRSAAWAIAEAARVKAEEQARLEKAVEDKRRAEAEEQERHAHAEAAWVIRSSAARANAEEVYWFSNNKKWVVVAASFLVSVGAFISVGGMKGVYDFIYTPRCQLNVPPSCAQTEPTVPVTVSAKPATPETKVEQNTDSNSGEDRDLYSNLAENGFRMAGSPVSIPSTHTLPPYPPASVRRNEQGTTTINLVIGIDGAVKGATLKDTSGSDRLDVAAIDFVKKHWRWEPAAQEARTTVQVTWKLEDK